MKIQTIEITKGDSILLAIDYANKETLTIYYNGVYGDKPDKDLEIHKDRHLILLKSVGKFNDNKW